MSGTASVATYVDSDTEVLSASNGVEYAYRVTGTSDAPPLVTLQHFRGNLDSWDPALIDALAAARRVITFDNRGVAATSGRTPSTTLTPTSAGRPASPNTTPCAAGASPATPCSSGSPRSTSRSSSPTATATR